MTSPDWDQPGGTGVYRFTPFQPKRSLIWFTSVLENFRQERRDEERRKKEEEARKANDLSGERSLAFVTSCWKKQ